MKAGSFLVVGVTIGHVPDISWVMAETEGCDPSPIFDDDLSAGESERDAHLRALLREHTRVVLGYALRRSNDPEDAADVWAETFAVAWRRIEEVPENARPWLLGIARRVLANGRRSAARRQRLVEALGARLTAVVSASVGDRAAELVDEALDRLPETDRELLRLSAWEGLSAPEIAVVLEIPSGAVRTRLHRARARLRAQLAELGVDADCDVVEKVAPIAGEDVR